MTGGLRLELSFSDHAGALLFPSSPKPWACVQVALRGRWNISARIDLHFWDEA